jgi:Peptidase MA superfamily
VGKALRRGVGDGAGRRSTLISAGRRLLVVAFLCSLAPRPLAAQAEAPERLDRGRFTAVYFPSERTLARTLLDLAVASDTFPGLRRPRARVLVAIAPDKRRFREWAGADAPEWGAAIAFPGLQRIILQGRDAGGDAGDPREVFRHEIAHLALHEWLGDLAPRWFDEGYASYAAREWTREDALMANFALALRGTPSLEDLDAGFGHGASQAQTAYALSYRAVAELAALDPERGLSLFFANWRETQSLDRGIRATYGMTLADFEKRWQQRTRRRYGAIALIGDLAIGGVLMLVVIFPLYLARRQRDRARMAALVASDEAAERAARESAIEELLRGSDGAEWRDEDGGPVDP